ncbi:MAG: diacylglycerol kinase family protein [Verrucomicrobia bacterium]|nr:diacylglycerol kinase family protein [Verrucomicrobiota bacterium]
MRVAVIFNPTARGNRARRFLGRLRELASEAELLPTPGPGRAGELAAEACRRGCDTIVAAGGDGTVSEVVDGLASVPGATGAVRLGVIPLGTINVFARELGIPHQLAQAWELLHTGTETRLDLPAGGADGRRPAEAAALRATGRLRSGFPRDCRRQLAVETTRWPAGLCRRRLAGGARPSAGGRSDGGRADRPRCAGADWQRSIVRRGRHGFPEADARDGLLEVRVFPRVTVLTLCRFGLAWWRGRPLSGCGTAALRGGRVALRCPSSMPVEVDGDNVGWLPGDFRVQREALRVVVPLRALAE